jgi:hypothetical protein
VADKANTSLRELNTPIYSTQEQPTCFQVRQGACEVDGSRGESSVQPDRESAAREEGFKRDDRLIVSTTRLPYGVLGPVRASRGYPGFHLDSPRVAHELECFTLRSPRYLAFI